MRGWWWLSWRPQSRFLTRRHLRRFTPAWGDKPVNGVHIVKGQRRDVLFWTEEEVAAYTCGALNAGDCFCIPGNEFGYASVEAMIGNNTDLRVGQSYVHNPYILDASRHVAVDVAAAPSWVREHVDLGEGAASGALGDAKGASVPEDPGARAGTAGGAGAGAGAGTGAGGDETHGSGTTAATEAPL